MPCLTLFAHVHVDVAILVEFARVLHVAGDGSPEDTWIKGGHISKCNVGPTKKRDIKKFRN